MNMIVISASELRSSGSCEMKDIIIDGYSALINYILPEMLWILVELTCTSML